MRRVLFIFVCALVAVPAALAAPRATGDGVLQLQDVYGKVQVGAPTAKGALWGQIDSGTILTTDPVVGDGQILVSGWDTKTPAAPDPNNPTSRGYVYRGSGMHFRVTGGKYKIVLSGSGINLTAVGVGVAVLIGSATADDPGTYALDSGNWLPVPLTASKVPFGTPPPTTPGP